MFWAKIILRIEQHSINPWMPDTPPSMVMKIHSNHKTPGLLHLPNEADNNLDENSSPSLRLHYTQTPYSIPENWIEWRYHPERFFRGFGQWTGSISPTNLSLSVSYTCGGMEEFWSLCSKATHPGLTSAKKLAQIPMKLTLSSFSLTQGSTASSFQPFLLWDRSLRQPSPDQKEQPLAHSPLPWSFYSSLAAKFIQRVETPGLFVSSLRQQTARWPFPLTTDPHVWEPRLFVFLFGLWPHCLSILSLNAHREEEFHVRRMDSPLF